MSNVKHEDALKRTIKDIYENDFESMDFYKDIQFVDFDFNRHAPSKKTGYLKYIAIAASLLLIVALSGAFGVILSNGSVSATGFEIEKQFVKLQNQFSIGKGAEEKYIDKDTDSIVFEVSSPDDIKKGTEFFPDLFISDQIPNRFSFDSLTITKSGNDSYSAVYIYFDDQGQLLSVGQQSILEEGQSITIVGITKEIKTSDGMIYISENPFGDGGNSGSYITDQYTLDVAGKITTDEIMEILNP